MEAQVGTASVVVSLAARPERRLIQAQGCERYVDFAIGVSAAPEETLAARRPLRLALVLDRSGSMHGRKLEMAKRATLALLERLTDEDEVAIVVFDDRIDLIQPVAGATAALKEQLRGALSRVQARGSTALHEGWLTGCNAIVSDNPDSERVARVLLLTDGLANQGITDTEQIAAQVSGVNGRSGVGTSTFGIGDDYNEALLAPMANAGGGQFHHLRTVDDIAPAFVGEVGVLTAAAASRVKLEIEAAPGVTPGMVSEYHLALDDLNRYSASIGDLLSSEEKHVVVRLNFPAQTGVGDRWLRARVSWTSAGGSQASAWQDLHFTYASDATCAAAAPDPTVMHWVGLHETYRAERVATQQSRHGDLAGARSTLASTRQYFAPFADEDTELAASLKGLEDLERKATRAPLSSASAKEYYYQSSRRSKQQRNLRDEPKEPNS